MKKKRLDEILIERGLVKDKEEAFVRITGGFVFIEGQKAVSPAQQFDAHVSLRIREASPYVGRGGAKLASAFENFDLDVSGKVCVDIGAATGGFTDVLLQRGARRVYAIDVGWGKLHPKLRHDARVVVMEKTNILYTASLPQPIEFVTADLSFTSLRFLLPVLKKFLKTGAELILLFKPQYEVPKVDVTHGIVKDETVRLRELRAFTEWAKGDGWDVKGVIPSPIHGAKGNVEYLVHLKCDT